jgi:hypothetical protein
MARQANESIPNTPTPEHVKDALKTIEEYYNDLATERGKYMHRCKKIREGMADEYESAGKRGISKKLLKKIVKERELERKMLAVTADLEDDDKSTYEMLVELLGPLANTPLGKAALASAAGNGAQAAAGA